MKYRKIAAMAALVLLSVSVVRSDDDAEQKKTKIRAGVTETLNDLYKIQPSAKGAIQSSAGYAVFKNFGTNLLVVSTGSGAGVAVNSKSKQETFMKMISGGAGLGVGVKDFRAVFVFQTQKAFDDFLSSGWSGSAQTDAAAKAGTSGGALSGAIEVSPDTYVYQITKNGLALQATLQGTKYYKDDDLNK
ncbi:MAG TPA: YSC84-related protein [Terracidiphilus sp.]|jgi:lipid-binding SYLF domain-containing protein|nr:YSC84-related protein [Terracidiphilus sp.]